MMLVRLLLAPAVAALLVAGATAAQDRDAKPGATTIAGFTGLWDYNAAESVNAANGRPEQAPLGATQRGLGAGRGGGNGGAGGRATLGGIIGRGRGDRGTPTFGPTPVQLAERRDLQRDLLEVPEQLRIDASADQVTFTDDLERTLTFPTSGEGHHYQISASRFEARTFWDGQRLRKEIEGVAGFRMTEEYFLGSDGQRLFVIIRLGEQAEHAPPVGVDRVYDRLPEAAGS